MATQVDTIAAAVNRARDAADGVVGLDDDRADVRMSDELQCGGKSRRTAADDNSGLLRVPHGFRIVGDAAPFPHALGMWQSIAADASVR